MVKIVVTVNGVVIENPHKVTVNGKEISLTQNTTEQAFSPTKIVGVQMTPHAKVRDFTYCVTFKVQRYTKEGEEWVETD